MTFEAFSAFLQNFFILNLTIFKSIVQILAWIRIRNESVIDSSFIEEKKLT
jgi:hypothetical protein